MIKLGGVLFIMTILFWITSIISIISVSIFLFVSFVVFMDNRKPDKELDYFSNSISEVYLPLLPIYVKIRSLCPDKTSIHHELHNKIFANPIDEHNLFKKENINGFIDGLIEWHTGMASQYLRDQFKEMFHWYGEESVTPDDYRKTQDVS